MVDKVEGAETTCKSCATKLVCRTKDYGGNYKSTLQWQNQDGTAHYKTTNGKDFTCNISNEEPTHSPNVQIPSLLDDGTQKLISNEAIFLYHIRNTIEKTIK